MHTTNQMKMVFPGISVNERTARSLVAAFLVQLDPTVEELAGIRRFRGGHQQHCTWLPQPERRCGITY